MAEEGLNDEDERLQSGESRDVGVDDLAGRHAVGLVERDVDGQSSWIGTESAARRVHVWQDRTLTVRGDELDDGNLGLGDDLDVLSEVGTTEDGRDSVEDGFLLLHADRIRLDDEIDISD